MRVCRYVYINAKTLHSPTRAAPNGEEAVYLIPALKPARCSQDGLRAVFYVCPVPGSLFRHVTLRVPESPHRRHLHDCAEAVRYVMPFARPRELSDLQLSPLQDQTN